jgi:hypothetical protein
MLVNDDGMVGLSTPALKLYAGRRMVSAPVLDVRGAPPSGCVATPPSLTARPRMVPVT